MNKPLIAHIIEIKSYLPKHVLTNHDLEKMVDTTDEWITSRTGMQERRIADANEYTSDMGAKAASDALQAAQVDPQSIDLIICATMSPDYLSPGTANIIQAKIGATRAAALDIQAACSGFLYGLAIAKSFIESGLYQTVLVIASEKMSAFIDYQDRDTCILFGDGAAAAIVTGEAPGFRIDAISLGSDGSQADLVIIPAGGSRHPASIETVNERMHYFKMSGKEVFKHAVRQMTNASKECLQKAGLTEDQVNWLVPHQANKRIIDAIAKNFNFSEEKVYKTVHKYGNTSASSIAIALVDLSQEHTFKNGERLLLTAFGGGLTWGACVLTKVLK
jgi:3-oxoacyl-[acyl-carrier-protein] synthase-3